MKDEDRNAEDHSWLQRLNYAWEPLRSSLTIRIFGIVSVFALLDGTLKFHEQAIKAGWISEKSVTFGQVAYCLLFLFTIRSLFLVAEEAGIHREEIAALTKQKSAQCEVFKCLHHVIHETRNTLLAEGAFQQLLTIGDGNYLKHLYTTIEGQLGMMEKAFRALTGKDCTIVLKIVKSDGSDEKLVSVCYSPGTALDRRVKSTLLPCNQGIAYQAIATKTICHSNNIKEDPRFWPAEQKDHFASNRYQTIIACPVINNKVVWGVLCFDWKDVNMYCKEYEQVLACFTDIVSLACYICHESRNVTSKTGDANERR